MRDEAQQHLVRRIQNGDRAAESELFDLYKNPILWKICRQLKAGREDLADLASEVYLAILEGLRRETLQPEKWVSLDAYVWGVTNNKIRDWLKKEKRDRKFFADHPPAEEIAAAAEEFFVETQERRQVLNSCLNALDAKFKQALELRYFQEFSVAEISDRLGIPTRRVSERLHYAVKKLRQVYQKKNKSASIFGFWWLLLP